MKKFLELLKKFWNWFQGLASSNLWKMTFPLASFVAITFISHSLSAFIALVIWLVTIAVNTDED